MAKKEKLPSGGVRLTYDDMQPKDFELTTGNVNHIDAISEHIEKYVGPIKSVFHEIISDKVHVDVHWVEPSEEQPFNILVTSGMSDRPMSVPEGMEDFRFAELCVLLPHDWPMDMDAFKNEDYYWPIRCLKENAKFPHEWDTFLCFGHTTSGQDNEPFSPNCPFCGFLVFVSVTLPEEFQTLTLENGDTIRFYCLIPLFAEEIAIKTEQGLDALLERFEENDVSDLIDMQRKNAGL